MPKFREVSGQFVGYVPDGTDGDFTPDREPMNGRVTFTPVFTGGLIAFPELSPPEFAHPKPIRARIVNGFVLVEVVEGVDDEEVVTLQPLHLMVTVDDEATQVWSWRAEFSEMTVGESGTTVPLPAWSFRVPDGTGPIDLTELVPLKSSGTVDVTKGPRGAGLETITAVDGQLVFAYTDGQETTIPVPDAVEGPEGPRGPAGSVGPQGEPGEKGEPGEVPELFVGNISDATPTGKNLMLAASEGAARNALGLQTGATTIAGAYSELKPGSTQTNSRVWSPKNISDYVEERAEAAKVFVNVKDYGAVGDGAADDTAAVQSAIDGIPSGGTIFFPPGNYAIDGTIELKDNLEITGKSATLTKKNPSVNTGVFIGWSTRGRGYGAGPSNIYVHDINFKGIYGETASGDKHLSILLHHSRNVVFERCNFIHCVTGSQHVFDLQGCDSVVIRDCEFIGSCPNHTIADSNWKESIQLDCSTREGTGRDGEVLANYDGLPCRNITITGNRWVGDGEYPAASTLVGIHRTVDNEQGQPFENILISNNTAEPGVRYSSNRAKFHFQSWIRNLVIEGNRIDNGGGTEQSFRFFAYEVSASFMPVDQITSTSPTSSTAGNPQTRFSLNGLRVRNNYFYNAENSAQAFRLTGRNKDIEFRGNSIVGGSGYSSSSTGVAFSLSSDDVNVVGNSFVNIPAMGLMVGETGVSNQKYRFVDNVCLAYWNYGLRIQTGVYRTEVRGNRFVRSSAILPPDGDVNSTLAAVYTSGTAYDTLIAGNHVAGDTLEIRGPNTMCNDNVVEGPNLLPLDSQRGISGVGATGGAIVKNNVLKKCAIVPASAGNPYTDSGNTTVP